jgi:hypothetical protein
VPHSSWLPLRPYCDDGRVAWSPLATSD